jgi:prepilin-type N-terminal cleavage/methylation domain-containing protein
MKSPSNHSFLGNMSERGFTLAEIVVAVAVCAMFGAAAFETNERLLVALRRQKETTAATMMLQERMESFRTIAYSDVAKYQPTNDADPTKWNAADIIQRPTGSEAPLGTLSETITVSGYLTTSGGAGYPADGSTPNQWVRDSQSPSGREISHNDTLATDYDLVRVDILLTWTGPGGRTRTRDLAAIFGKGNIGP